MAESTKRCPYCREWIIADAIKCKHCGSLLVDTPVITSHDPFTTVKAALASKYEIIAEVGRGGNATVYQAIQKNLERKVALKILLPHLVNDQEFLDRFHMEAQSIAKLRHPNIVTIFDEGNENGIHFMAMEFLEGPDLHRLIEQQGKVKVEKILEMARRIANALDYAHSYGVIHRDVKSSNIVMTPDRIAVLTDFGIAHAGMTSKYTSAGSILGTPEFMSPEQADGRPVDARSDFYSLGVVLYHALSGRFPFSGENPLVTMHKILHDEYVPIRNLVNLPPSIQHAIDRCLSRDPANRIQNGRELIELLEPRVKGKTSEHRKAPSRVPSIPHHYLFRFFVVLTVVCTAALGYLIWDRIMSTGAPENKTGQARGVEEISTQVPNVIGLTKDEAIRILEHGGFVVRGIHRVAVPEPGKKGKVDNQRPDHGTFAKHGSMVDLFIGE
jgi:serine/threonine protein kinase